MSGETMNNICPWGGEVCDKLSQIQSRLAEAEKERDKFRGLFYHEVDEHKSSQAIIARLVEAGEGIAKYRLMLPDDNPTRLSVNHRDILAVCEAIAATKLTSTETKKEDQSISDKTEKCGCTGYNTLECGCRVKTVHDDESDNFYSTIDFCPLHANAEQTTNKLKIADGLLMDWLAATHPTASRREFLVVNRATINYFSGLKVDNNTAKYKAERDEGAELIVEMVNACRSVSALQDRKFDDLGFRVHDFLARIDGQKGQLNDTNRT